MTMDEAGLPDAAFAEATDIYTPAERLQELAYDVALQPLVAANPSTPSIVLARLGEARQISVRRAVVQNPNAPLHTLGQLAGEFPEEFLRNPVIPILNLARPNFVEELPFLAWASLLRFEHLSPVWFQQIALDGNYQRSHAASGS